MSARKFTSIIFAISAFIGIAAQAHADVLLNPNDRHSSVTLSADLLSARFTSFNGIRGVRSDVAIQPGQGFYYFEGSRSEAAADFGFGVASAAEALTNAPGTTTNSAGANMLGGGLRYGMLSSGTPTGSYDTFGFAVDYRTANPIVHLVASQSLTGDAVYIGTVNMTAVTTPIHILVSARANSTGFRQTINAGNDPVGRPFRYTKANVEAVLNARFYRGGDGLTYGWPTTVNANRAGTVSIAGGPRAIVLGAPVTINATATDPEDGDRTSSIVWTDQQSSATSNGGTFTFTPTTLGRHTIVALATDSRGLTYHATTTVRVILSGAVDADDDGISQNDEAALNSSNGELDTDHDGLTDAQEIITYHSKPDDSDTDDDGMSDYYEVLHGLNVNNPNDASLDLDGDGHTNISEYLIGTSASSNTSYPGRGLVRLSATDRDPAVTLSADRFGASFAGGGARGVRSEVAITSGSGWYYFEGRRESTLTGNYGFGVASASAPLNAAGGSTDQSVGVDTLGRIFYNGSQVATFTDPTINTYYGIAINYSGANPVVYVITECNPVRTTSYNTPDGYACVAPPPALFTAGGNGFPIRISAPITMANVTGPLHALVYGDNVAAGFIATINGGGDKTKPFNYPANFYMFNEGITGAEFMGTGFGPENTYAGRIIPEKLPRVFFEKSTPTLPVWKRTDPNIRLSADALSAAYDSPQKAAVRANQGMMGEFRYFEVNREIAPANFGQGLTTAHTQINPYCFSPEQPSMSLNSVGGMWRNLISRGPSENFSTTNTHYGFAVDYRGARPIVRTIVGGAIVSTMTLDTFVPLYPTIYGNPQGARATNTANFGAKPFVYNARTILQAAGVDVSQFQVGWGVHTAPDPTPTTRPDVVAQSISAVTTNLAGTITITASANDTEDGNITSNIRWSVNNVAQATTGGTFVFQPTGVGRMIIRATITDSAGATDVTGVVVDVIDADDDGDGILTLDEIAIGTDPYNPDTDGDGLLDGAEVNTHHSNPLLADSDRDGMGDAYEVANGFLVLTDDAGSDADNDGYGNLEEMRASTNPNSAASAPARRFALLSTTDRHADSVIAANQRGFGPGSAGAASQRAVRADISLAPGGGFFYYEGRRETGTNNYGFGVGTGAHALDNFAGSTNQSAGMNTIGFVAYNNAQVQTFTAANTDYYGIAVDYRGATPIAYFIGSTTVGGPGVLIRTVAMPSVTTPLYPFVFGWRVGNNNILQTVNFGTSAFRFDVRTILTNAGVSGASNMLVGWSERLNRLPSVAITAPSATQTPLGVTLGFAASASDPDDGNISSSVTWWDNGVYAGTGANYTFPASSPGVHVVRARIVDVAGAVAFASRNITVLDTGDLDDDNDGLRNSQELSLGTNPNNPDTDGDGLTDGAEVNNHGTNPLSEDSDGDLMDDEYEILNSFNPLVANGNADADGDGYSNLEEYYGYTNPNDSFTYPGPARITRLSTTDKHSAVTLTSDRLSISIASGQNNQHRGVRSDVSIPPHAGFFYYEGKRLVGPGDYSFGVGTGSATLERFLGGDANSAGVSATGFIAYNGSILTTYTAANADTYGFAVDYRGNNPVLYVIASTTAGGPGVLLRTINMTTVTTPLFVFLTGVRAAPAAQQQINTGNDLVGRPFRYDPVAILTAAGVSGANTLELGWTP